MKNKAVFSVESAIAFLALVTIIAAAGHEKNDLPWEFAAQQKARDLLTVWAITGQSENEMIEDAELFLGKNNFELRMQAQEDSRGNPGERIVEEIKVHMNGKAGKLTLIIKKQGFSP